MYAGRDDERIRNRNRCMERLILSFFTSKIIAKRWHGLVDQYVFVQSYDDRPKFWNLIHKVTTGVVSKDDGGKAWQRYDVPEHVRPAILEKLRAILEQPGSLDHTEPADPKRNLEEPVVTVCRRPRKVITVGPNRRKTQPIGRRRSAEPRLGRTSRWKPIEDEAHATLG